MAHDRDVRQPKRAKLAKPLEGVCFALLGKFTKKQKKTITEQLTSTAGATFTQAEDELTTHIIVRASSPSAAPQRRVPNTFCSPRPPTPSPAPLLTPKRVKVKK